MKSGLTLQQLAAKIEEQAAQKKDLVATASALSVTSMFEEPPRLRVENVGEFPMRDLAVSQMAEFVGVPLKYAKRMLDEEPALFAENFNTWLRRSPARRLVRTLSGHARAFLSDRYQRIDNREVAEAAFMAMQEFPGIVVRSSEITESRLYIKVAFPELTREIKSTRKGDMVSAGAMISNSEVGLGAVSVTPWAEFLVCTNGMVREGGKRWNHVGSRLAGIDTAYLSDDTVAASDRADLLLIRDTMRAALSAAPFEAWLAKVQETTERQLEGDIPKAVEVLAQRLDLTKDEGSSVLRHLIAGGDLSQYGLVNAVTRTAEDAASYDRATELEAAGDRVVNLKPAEWRELQLAA